MSSGARVSIPNSVRKTIQNIKEITGNLSEEEIYAMLKECSMDPNVTAQKLLLQDTFHEVKRKRDRRKEVTMASQISLTAEMEVQTTPTQSPSREALTISILPHTGAATMPSTEPAVVSSSTIQDWLLGISAVQETVANLSIEGRVKQLTGEDQQLVDQFFDLLDQPLDDLAPSHTTALTDCLEAIVPLVPQLFDPDQMQAFQNFLSEFPQHLVAINQFHAEPKTIEAQVDQVRKAVNALTEASTRSQALIAQLATLSAEEAQLEAQLAHVRAQKATVEQEQANLSQQIPNLLVQAEGGPPAIKKAQARLRQNKIGYQIALQAWSRLSMYFQKD